MQRNPVDAVNLAIKVEGPRIIPQKKKYIASSIKWYQYLKVKDRPDTNSRALLQYEPVEDKNLLVCRELEYRSYGRFTNYLIFWKYHLKEADDESRCFYEVILGNQAQKPYFDLDIPIDAESSSSALTVEDSCQLIDQLIHAILNVNDKITLQDIMVFSSHTTSLQGTDTYVKKSYHVVVDNWCLIDHEDNKSFCELTIKLVSSPLRGFIDHLVYKSVQQLRIFQSHKYGSNRSKIMAVESKWVPPIEAESENHLTLMKLGGSLITNTSYCKILPSYKREEKKKYTYIGDEIVLEENEIKEALDLCANFWGLESSDSNDFPFSVIDVKGGMVCLKRLRPSYCSVCERDHEHENPFLVICGKNRKVYFDCRRSIDGKRVLVGAIGDEYGLGGGIHVPSLDELTGKVNPVMGKIMSLDEITEQKTDIMNINKAMRIYNNPSESKVPVPVSVENTSSDNVIHEVIQMAQDTIKSDEEEVRAVKKKSEEHAESTRRKKADYTKRPKAIEEKAKKDCVIPDFNYFDPDAVCIPNDVSMEDKRLPDKVWVNPSAGSIIQMNIGNYALRPLPTATCTIKVVDLTHSVQIMGAKNPEFNKIPTPLPTCMDLGTFNPLDSIFASRG